MKQLSKGLTVSILAFGIMTTAALAEPVGSSVPDPGPVVLTNGQMDEITAGGRRKNGFLTLDIDVKLRPLGPDGSTTTTSSADGAFAIAHSTSAGIAVTLPVGRPFDLGVGVGVGIGLKF